jgi:DNA-binding Lrp family transcriptional regulator
MSDFRTTVMNNTERSCIKKRILKLAMLKATGTPEELANKFEISERSVKRIIKEMREEGIRIKFDYIRLSYVIDEN